MKQTYNFPFFGAGEEEETTYFEWVSVSVIFKKEPSEEQKKQIKKNMPVPITEDIYWNENIMSVSSGEFAHLNIAKTYKTKNGLDPNEDNSDFVAAASQVAAFNTDIERWLNEIHEISPLFLTYRGEDWRADETVFSDWHKWSLNQFEVILPYFDDVVSNFDHTSEKGRILFYILGFISVEDVLKLDDKYISYRYPGQLEFDAFEKGNIEPLKNISDSRYAEKAIMLFNTRLNKEHQKNIIKDATVFLDFESKVSESTFERLCEVLFTYLTDINSKSVIKIAKKITSEHFIDKIAAKGYRLMTNGKHKESIRLFEKILLTSAEPNTSTGFYTNMLWVFQKDNTGLPINKKLNKLALAKSIPKGAEYPAIFFNACCIYTEMKEYDKAYEMVQEAIAHHYDKNFMLSEIKALTMFKEFRKKTDVLNLLKNYTPEPTENPKPRFIGQNVSYHRFATHIIYGRGYRLDHFSHFILINGNVNIKGEFKDTYTDLIAGIRIDKKNSINKNANIKERIINVHPDLIEEEHKKGILVIVNGNLTAKSINEDKGIYILVMGKINCKNIIHKEIIEKEKTNFNYVPLKPKK